MNKRKKQIGASFAVLLAVLLVSGCAGGSGGMGKVTGGSAPEPFSTSSS